MLATQGLHRSEQELQPAMESAGMGMWFYDPATLVVFADERMDRIFGSPEPNGVVDHWLDLLHLNCRSRSCLLSSPEITLT